jgi:hypothetical protein
MNTLLGPAGLILLGSVIVVIGAFWASSQESKFKTQIFEKNDEIKRLSKKIGEDVTGGDSIPVITYLFNPDLPKNILNVILRVEGINPLYDVRIVHSDVTKAEYYTKKWLANNNQEISKSELNEYELAKKSAPALTGGNFNPNNTQTNIGMVVMDSTHTEYKFSTTIIARNGKFIQDTVLIKDKK